MRRALLASVVVTALVAPRAASASEVATSTAAGRSFRVFVPTTPKTPAAAVVLLHGCTQTNDAFAQATRFDEVAEAEGIYAIYPDEPSSIGANKCWRWYEPAHQKRGSGEPAELEGAVTAIVQARGIDPERVYVAGISAGAAMSLVLAVTYPDRFAAAGAIAGVPYGAASSFSDGAYVSYGGASDPAALAGYAKTAMGTLARPMPVLVVHGSSDGIVAPVNGEQIARQFRELADLTLGAGSVLAPTTTTGSAGYAFTRTAYPVANGASVVEHLVVTGLGHAWPGGKQGGSYADPSGPDASRALWTFFAPRTVSAPLPAEALPAPVPVPDGETDAGTPGTPAPPGAEPEQAPGGTPAARGDASGCATSSARAPALPTTALLGLGLVAVARRRRRA